MHDGVDEAKSRSAWKTNERFLLLFVPPDWLDLNDLGRYSTGFEEFRFDEANIIDVEFSLEVKDVLSLGALSHEN